MWDSWVPVVMGWGVWLMELNGEMRGERCDGKAWTQTWVSSQSCWPDLSPHCSKDSGHEKFLGNFLQTYFVFLLSGTVGTIVTGRVCRGPGQLSALRCQGTPPSVGVWAGLPFPGQRGKSLLTSSFSPCDFPWLPTCHCVPWLRTGQEGLEAGSQEQKSLLPLFLALWTWTHFLTSLRLALLICEVRIPTI